MNKKAEANEGDAMLKVAEAFVGMGDRNIDTGEESLETVSVKILGVRTFYGDPNDPRAPDFQMGRLL